MNTDLNKRLLVVDDEEINLFITKKMLGEHYEIDSASNGYDAMELLSNKHFDVILLDINLGDERMDGIRVMRNIRQCNKFKHCKIIAVTAFSDARDWYMAEGFDELFMKPLAREGILKMLEEVQQIPAGHHPVYIHQVA